MKDVNELLADVGHARNAIEDRWVRHPEHKRGEAEIIVAKNNLRHIGTVTLKHSWGGAFDDMHNKQLYFKDFWE